MKLTGRILPNRDDIIGGARAHEITRVVVDVLRVPVERLYVAAIKDSPRTELEVARDRVRALKDALEL